MAVCALGVAALLLASHASAAPQTFTVDSNGDDPDQTIDGVCATVGGQCTLRAAIQEANATPGPDVDTIDFAPSVTGQILLTSALPQISDDLIISGPGADQLAVDGANAFRVLETGSPGTYAISGLTITHGLAPVGGGGTNAAAGGILAGGDVTLNQVVVTNNTASVNGAGNNIIQVVGGGIVAGGGTLILANSTVKDNQATAVNSGEAQAFSQGGGIAIDPGATLRVDHSTITGNIATATITGGTGDSGTRASGGGLYIAGSAPTGTLTLDQSTITGNSAIGSGGTAAIISDLTSGGGIYQESDSLTATGTTVSANSVAASGAFAFTAGANLQVLQDGGTFQDTIVADPIGAENCGQGAFTSNGYNLADDGTCDFNQTTDIVGPDPMLGPLADNGGPTQTRALAQGSPAIDKGKSFGATTDQRGAGFPRISNSPTIANAAGGDGSDIGAFERDSVPPNRPTITASVPRSPANNNNPKLRGSAEAGSTVRVYKTAACTGPAIQAGSASAFASPGLAVHVTNNSATTFRVTATDASNNTSACSPGFRYVEDSKPPNTSITSVTVSHVKHTARVAFSSNEPGSTFRCKIDQHAYAPCTSPKLYTGLTPGSHTVRVIARDRARNADPTPAAKTFAV